MGTAAIFVAETIIRLIEDVEAAVKGIQDFIEMLKDFGGEVEKALDKIPNIFSDTFENAYLGSIPWIAKGKLLQHIQTLPFSVKAALQPIPDVFDTAFSQAFILVAEDFDNLKRVAKTIMPEIKAEVVEVMEEVKSATELATLAFIEITSSGRTWRWRRPMPLRISTWQRKRPRHRQKRARIYSRCTKKKRRPFCERVGDHGHLQALATQQTLLISALAAAAALREGRQAGGLRRYLPRHVSARP